MADEKESAEFEITPEMRAHVELAREYQIIASTLHRMVEEQGIQIDDLAVAFSGGTAILSGIARNRGDSEKAAQIVCSHDAVKQFHNELIVLDERRSWWKRLLGR